MQNWSHLNSKQNSTILLSGSSDFQSREVASIYNVIFECKLNNSNPDFFQISKSDFEKNNIPVEEVRNWLKNNNFKPFQYQKKLFVIWNSEDLENEAQNTLLKTLEEHNNDSVFVLTTENKNLLLDTILSRCQIYEEVRSNIEILKSEYDELDFGNIAKLNETTEKILKISNSAKKWSEAKKFLNSAIYYSKKHFQSSEKYYRIEQLLNLLEYSELYVNLKLILYNAIQILMF